MSDAAFREAIKKLANGRNVCNCGQAYYDATGRCAHGCSANQISAKYQLAVDFLGYDPKVPYQPYEWPEHAGNANCNAFGTPPASDCSESENSDGSLTGG